MQPEHKSIGELAYRLWQSRGCPDGTAQQDWLDAERQLRAMQTSTRPVKPEAVDDPLKGTFPASDPPASHIPDEPPVNADAKWKAAEAARKKAPRQKSPDRSSRSNPNSDPMR
jgi:hypothetical protein